ncbi:unnamed protein product, partial [Meganyctiphanes norvegica]
MIFGFLVPLLLSVMVCRVYLRRRGRVTPVTTNPSSDIPMSIFTPSEPAHCIENILYEEVKDPRKASGSRSVSSLDMGAWTSLMTCVVDDNSDMAQFLLKRREAPNVGCGVHATPPLVEGAWRGYLEVCHALLQYDANPEEADSRGESCLYKEAAEPDILSHLQLFYPPKIVWFNFMKLAFAFLEPAACVPDTFYSWFVAHLMALLSVQSIS